MKLKAAFSSQLEDNIIRCELCPHCCVIKNNKTGLCKIRQNINGILYNIVFNEPVALQLDPIEKKPLYHFHPGSSILSIGFGGCNMSCPFCQNYKISQSVMKAAIVDTELILKTIKNFNCKQIAYTYTEPIVCYEFMNILMEKALNRNIHNVLITNGMVNQRPFKRILEKISAANIDLKSFDKSVYKQMNGDLETVKNSIVAAYESKTHLEITHLVVTDFNDNKENFEEMCQWLSDIDKNIPLHINRYFPAYKYKAEQTKIDVLNEFYETARNYLNYVYIGNAGQDNKIDTICPNCGTVLIERDNNYNTHLMIKKPKCKKCKEKIPIIF